MNTKTLLILTDGDFVGGAETNYTFILPILKEHGWRPVFVTSGDKNISEYFSRQQLQVEVFPGFSKYFSFTVNGRVSLVNIFRTWLSLRKNRIVLKGLFKKYQPLVIVSNSMVSHWLLSAVGSGVSCKRIMHLHDIIDTRKVFGLYGRGLNHIASKMDSIIVVSDAVKERLSSSLGYKAVKIYNPMKATGLPSKPLSKPMRIGMFARYTEWKGHWDFLYLAKALSGPEYEFVSYGNTTGNEAYFRRLQAFASSLPNASHIHLNGFCYNVTAEMAKCDLILQLSILPEPFSRIMIESNACRVPVYAYDGGGVQELFRELSLAGLLIPQGDLHAMIDAIKSADKRTFVFPDLREISPDNYFARFEKVLVG
ncbi:glycosyltransferase [Flavitalea sp. BT771]|uniref:glycosyltransferase n=1 Tax=Flavitalea sp. BT771 TaxID=3063329 RepID=UPI0026E1E6F6|nr:glycosyltransferase [Flavitalea sp. BT771]MDO6429405.1 glycosyltransferase [Flavitalea sp. BT771]MDV6218467.1 glycosyltransferase [Flavitalea sp. BT771]